MDGVEGRGDGEVNPYQVTRDFEAALCAYSGAPFAVALNSCSAALLLCVDYLYPQHGGVIVLPRRTYVSVPMSVIRGGASVAWSDESWSGSYQLKPYPIWDSARRFTSGMYVAGQFQCVSFAASKILAAEQGGAILHDNRYADASFRRMRFDGRTEGVDPHKDQIKEVGHHVMMTPSVAAGLLVRLYHLPKHNPDMPDYDYPDLSKMPAFQ